MSEGDLGAWPRRKNSDNPRYPGEPLYKIEEIADRLGTTTTHLLGLMHHHPGLNYWHFRRGSQRSGKQYNLYRLSDAKRWWASLQEKEI